MIKRLYGRLIFLFLILFSFGWMAETAYAQTCSLSSTFTAAGTASSSCFVKAGNQTLATLSGTWVGTNQWQMSRDNGASWVIVASYTANASFKSQVQNRDVLFRWFPYAYTSGTVTYVIRDLTTLLGRIKYSNVPIGSVAYGSLGTSAVCSATEELVTDIEIGSPKTLTGAALLIGATGGTDKFIYILRDSTGRLVANTSTAGVTVGTANTFQEIAFTAPVDVQPGRYYISEQCNGTTATIRRIAASTFVTATGAALTSVFGTIPQYLATMPTGAPTADKGPFFYVY